MEKQERKERKILTDNRMMTVNKRECSFEGLVSQLENGEDGIYNLITDNKNQIFQPKVTITKKDLDEIQPLRQLREAINVWEAKLKVTEGKDAFVIKKALIEMRKDQYVIKNAYRRPIVPNKLTRSTHVIMLPDETSSFDDEEGYPIPKGVSLLNPVVCSAILCNYSRLKEDSFDRFEGDLYYLMLAFDEIADKALKEYPLYEIMEYIVMVDASSYEVLKKDQSFIYTLTKTLDEINDAGVELYEKIVECKVDGLQNTQIQEILQMEFGIKHSLEYISSLWRKKIPKLIASQAEDEYLYWYYLNIEKGKYKKCSRCGQIKLAHNKYFSKNKTSRDGYYSICKKCRNSKNKTKKS